MSAWALGAAKLQGLPALALLPSECPPPRSCLSVQLSPSRSLSLPKCPSQLNFSRLLLPRGKQGGDFFGLQAPKRTKETRPTWAFRFPRNCSASRSALPAAAAFPKLFRISVGNSTANEWSRPGGQGCSCEESGGRDRLKKMLSSVFWGERSLRLETHSSPG